MFTFLHVQDQPLHNVVLMGNVNVNLVSRVINATNAMLTIGILMTEVVKLVIANQKEVKTTLLNVMLIREIVTAKIMSKAKNVTNVWQVISILTVTMNLDALLVFVMVIQQIVL